MFSIHARCRSRVLALCTVRPVGSYVWTNDVPFYPEEGPTMPDLPKIGFAPLDRLRGVLVVFCAEGLKFGPATQKALTPINDQFRRAAAADRFTGKNGSSLELIAPPGLDVPRLIVVGTGKERDLKDRDLLKLGGVAMGRVPGAATQATIVAEFGAGPLKPEQISDLVLGARLRAYKFDRYK